MFVDARKLEQGSVIEGAVCIVGAGVAGIALALEFMRRGIDTLLLESGGFKADEGTLDLNRGENVGLPYLFDDGCRSRHFGGSSNCWGGWCSPLLDQDLAVRDWIPDSGWPFDRSSLQPYYERAHPLLSLGPMNYDVGSWVAAMNRADVRRIPLHTGQVHDVLTQFSSPSRLGTVYRREFKHSPHVRVLLHANVVDIETDLSGQTVLRLHVRTLSGRQFVVKPGRVVLACGGIENPRLLLASNRIQPAGVGNSNDLVGRYFADHPRIALGNVRLRPQWQRNKLYDLKFHYLNKAVSAHGTYVSSQFSLSPGVQKREGLLNAQMWFSSILAGEGTDAADALGRIKNRMHGRSYPERTFLGDLAQLVRQPAHAAGYAATRILSLHSLVRKVAIEIICEPVPQRDSRVMLSDKLDALGMPRVRVDWRVGQQVLHTIDRTLAIFAAELRQAEVADIDLPPPFAETGLPAVPPRPWHNLGVWHHMGTTRMHDSPQLGVVDRNCKVHGIDNLFIAGSSVFPTYGANFPTITISALALRLADHLAAEMSSTRERGVRLTQAGMRSNCPG